LKRRLKNLKFRLKKGKGSVHHFTDEKGDKHYPGDIVDLPRSYEGVAWLEPIEEKAKVIASPAKVERAPEIVPPAPLSEKKQHKKA
jgi:hypothetical protein